jgi:hypothetical protein
MDETTVAKYITDTFANVETTVNFGYTFFFYGPDRMHPFATIASTGNEYERVSNLDRPGVFRLNIGVSKQSFQGLFGADKVDVSAYDFTALDTIMPHPDMPPSTLCACSIRATRRGRKCRLCWRRRMNWLFAGTRSVKHGDELASVDENMPPNTASTRLALRACNSGVRASQSNLWFSRLD